MKAIDKFTNFLKRQPKVTVILTVPEEIINNKKYNNVSMTVDGLEFFGRYGLLKNNLIFKGKLKVDIK